MRGPSSNPLGDSDFDSWIKSSFFDDDDDKGPKTGHSTVTTVTSLKPTSAKATAIDFDAPLANGDEEPSTTGATTATSDPNNVHYTNLPEATEGGPRPSNTGHPKGEEQVDKTHFVCKANDYQGTGNPHLTMAGQDAFVPLATGGIPQNIKSRDDHPVQKHGVGNTTTPIETNKFYSAIFLGSQTNATFCHPYVLAWAKGSGNANSFGMAVSHSEQDKLAEGPPNKKMPGSPVSFYVNPVGIQSVILSATELDNTTVLTAEDPKPFSANAVLRPRNSPQRNITIPVLQGMGYVTGIYTDLQPLLQSGVLFQKVVSAGSPKQGIYKYRASLEDGSTWLLYATPNDGKDPKFHLESHTKLRGPEHWSGVLQVTKNPAGHGGEKLFDNSAGVFPVQGVISGAVAERDGQYSLSWYKAGKDAHSTPLIMFALPHHIESFDDTTHGRTVDIHLRTTTKGNATAVIGEQWTMVERELPVEMGFGPWSPKGAYISPQAKKVILEAAKKDLDEDFDKQSDLNSMYFSGKALSKFATLVYTTSEIAGDKSLAASGLEKLKNSFARFVENRQQFPLAYDNVWKGVVSSASYGSGDVGADFGNTLYNDHHFHYGYFIHAAAIIGYFEPNWLKDNKDWVNMLVRDAGNPSADDPQFPFSRAFDWFHGHSWAKGLFESFDGKDQESTSEDTMFAYAVKMWGNTIGDASMEARGNLMLGVLRRSLHNYFLLESDNKNHVPNFVPNKVTGIVSSPSLPCFVV